MKPPTFVRPLSPEERHALRAGLRSPDAFTLRRCQILLASTDGQRPKPIAAAVGCCIQSVRNANLLRTAGSLAPGHASSSRRVFSLAHWSMIRLACALARYVIARLPADVPIVLVGDDTVVAHPGPHVYGQARHRDPVRSSHAFTAWRYGPKWLVLAVLVRFPVANRPWALPVLIALYRSEEDDRRERHRHRTPAQHMIRLLRLMMGFSA